MDFSRCFAALTLEMIDDDGIYRRKKTEQQKGENIF